MKLRASLCLAVFVVLTNFGAATAQQETLRPAAPFKLFDNLYYVGLQNVSSYVLKTSQGLILIDDSIRVGDTTVKMYITPGHTPGVTSLEFPVMDQGKTYKAFMFGGPRKLRTIPEIADR